MRATTTFTTALISSLFLVTPATTYPTNNICGNAWGITYDGLEVRKGLRADSHECKQFSGAPASIYKIIISDDCYCKFYVKDDCADDQPLAATNKTLEDGVHPMIQLYRCHIWV
ncbi:hypothetical protein P280DRAFT_520516 [Massarina eburnea CBS 473.64]|uniref:Uncharacterized protein n=1 Tax=Massarina eburnea CBS 473.64 TaxID=1395130 RepID=A0A6A6RRT2_9PLEO|nr:hypothetical protein P280DRAFT_520516 [Massarina eburnea CBS 473.64]